MPPKSKAEVAKKQKVVEDKTFGLKNKNKSKNVQKYVQQIQQSAQPKIDPTKLAAKKKKDEEKARQKELDELFKVAVVQPKVPPGVDPKSILCEFFKVGQCVKGFKCKFSHDLNVQRKGEKIDLFSDQRDDDGTMEDWDLSTLEKVIESKKNEYNKNKPTDILMALDEEHRLAESKDYEVKVAFLQLGIAAGCKKYYGEVEKTLKEVGRMKYLRPLYKALVQANGGEEEKVFAKRVFSEARDCYHPIAAGGVESILSKHV